MANPLVGVWVCFSLSVTIMAIRLILGRKCRVKWDVGDSLTVAAIVLSVARIAFTHVTIEWKTNKFSEEYRKMHHFTGLEIYHREMGSKFTLAARVLYIAILWTQKFVLLAFYRMLVKDMAWGRLSLLIYTGIFMLSFSVGIVVTFIECRPITKFWRLFPDPGNCPKVPINLILIGSFNVVTDLMLIALPIPILLRVKLSLPKKLQLGLLFCTGIMIVMITAARIPYTLRFPNSQTGRLVWTTGECLASSFAANAPSLYSFRRRLKVRNGGGNTGSSDISPVRRVRELHGLDTTVQQATSVHELKEMAGKETPAGSKSTGSIFVHT